MQRQMTTFSKIRMTLVAALAGMLLAVASACMLPGKAQASDYEGDILLGAFFSNTEAQADNALYVSCDGTSFVKLTDIVWTEFFENVHVGQSDPSIIYKDGYFWQLSGWNRYDDKFWPMISYSKDLINWTLPEGNELLSGHSTQGVPLASAPWGQTTSYDFVAPEWFVDDDGTVYIVVSAGYFGHFHDNATNDRCQPYLIKVDELSAADPVWYVDQNTGKGAWWPNELVFKAQTAQPLEMDHVDRIDGTLYKEGGYYYLMIKRQGLYEELWRTTTIDDPASWKIVDDNIEALYGYEGASLVKFGGAYHFYGDQVSGTTAVGEGHSWSTRIADSYTVPEPLEAVDSKGAACETRHGTVIRLSKNDPRTADGWQAVMDACEQQGIDAYLGDDVQRIAGPTRMSTAAAASQTGFAKGSGTVIVATGYDFPDALSASALAGLYQCPIVTTTSTALGASLSDEAKAEIKRLGASRVVILGGTNAVSNQAARDIKAIPGVTTVSRIYGSDRLATNINIYKAGKGKWSKTCFIAKGYNYADALAISPYAYASNSPVFLANPDGTLSEDIAKIIKADFDNVVVLGGTGAGGIQDSTVKELEKTWTRLGGQTRMQTSQVIAKWATGGMKNAKVQPNTKALLSYDGAGLAMAWNYPDALVSVDVLGPNRSVLLLLDTVGGETPASIAKLFKGTGASSAYVFGGTAAVPGAYKFYAEAAVGE